MGTRASAVAASLLLSCVCAQRRGAPQPLLKRPLVLAAHLLLLGGAGGRVSQWQVVERALVGEAATWEGGRAGQGSQMAVLGAASTPPQNCHVPQPTCLSTQIATTAHICICNWHMCICHMYTCIWHMYICHIHMARKAYAYMCILHMAHARMHHRHPPALQPAHPRHASPPPYTHPLHSNALPTHPPPTAPPLA